MDCERAQDLLEREPDEPLSPADGEELARHLAACPACWGFAEQAAALLRQLGAPASSDGDDAAWQRCLALAVPEGATRLLARRDRRAVCRLAWATAAVWVVAGLVGRGVHPPSRDGRRPTQASIQAHAEVAAEDFDPYEGLAPRLAISQPTPPFVPRQVVIERLLSGEDPYSDAPPLPHEQQQPPNPGPRAEAMSHV
jgi:hypothetical protein